MQSKEQIISPAQRETPIGIFCVQTQSLQYRGEILTGIFCLQLKALISTDKTPYKQSLHSEDGILSAFCNQNRPSKSSFRVTKSVQISNSAFNVFYGALPKSIGAGTVHFFHNPFLDNWVEAKKSLKGIPKNPCTSDFAFDRIIPLGISLCAEVQTVRIQRTSTFNHVSSVTCLSLSMNEKLKKVN